MVQNEQIGRLSVGLRKPIRRSRVAAKLLSAAAVATGLLSASSTLATSGSWNATPDDGNWVTTPGGENNWSTGAGTFPGATSGTTNTETATFNVASSTTSIAINSASLNLKNITFDTNASSYIIGDTAGNSLFLTSGGAISITGGLTNLSGTLITETINAPLVIEGTNGSYTLSNIAATGTAAKSAVLDFNGTIQGAVAGNTQLILTATSNNANTISGDISNGFATNLSVTKNTVGGNTGTWVLSGINSYTGGTTITAGTLSVGQTENLGATSSALKFNGGVLQITGTTLTSVSTLGHAVTFIAGTSAGFDIASASNTFTVDQTLNQTTGGFSKAGLGTLILSTTNSYSGATGLSNGSMVLSAAGAISNSAISVSTATGNTAVLSETVDNAITGSSSLAFGGSGSGTNQVILSKANNFSGAIAMGNDLSNILTLSDFNAIASASSVTVTNGVVQLLNNSSGTFNTPTFQPTAGTNFFVGNNGSNTGNTLTVSGTIIGQSGRTIGIKGDNGYILGLTNISIAAAVNGSLALNPTTATVTVGTITNALTTAGGETIILSGTSSGNEVTGTISNNSASMTAGFTSLTATSTGSWRLSGTNTYTGSTTVTGGMLIVAGSLASPTVNVATSGVASGTLAGSGTVQGITLNAGGVIAPGEAGTNSGIGTLTSASGGVTWNGQAALSTFAQMHMDLSGTDSTSDVLSISGAFTKGTGNVFDFDFGGTGVVGNTYTLVTFTSSTFTSASNFGVVGVTTGTFSLNSDNLQFTVSAVPEPGSLAMSAGAMVFGFLRRRRRVGMQALSRNATL